MTQQPSTRAARPALLLAVVVLLGALTGCSDEQEPTSTPFPSATDTGVVHIVAPTATGPTTDVAGSPITPLPAGNPVATLSQTRVRGDGYRFSLPVGWSQGDAQGGDKADTVAVPDDAELPFVFTVDKPFGVSARSDAEVITQLREEYSNRGITLRAAQPHSLAGFEAPTLVIDQDEHTRHVYTIAVYAEKAYAVRMTYDPEREQEALGVYEAILSSWSWE